MMMPTVLSAALRGLALGGVLMLGACNGVGEGIAPVSSVLLPAGGEEGDVTLKSFTCLNTTLTLIVEFSNGARGDFTSRAKWSSNKSDVVEVSNGDSAVPEQEGFFYGKGVLIPKKMGSAVITAQYLDFKNTITVTVVDPTNFKVSPAEANLAIGSSQDLSLTVELDGVSTSIDNFARWGFAGTAPADTVATVNTGTGTIVSPSTGLASATPFQVAARIPGCALKNTQGLDADGRIAINGNVSRLISLALSKEFAGTDKLVIGTTERITATGTLENSSTQDVSALVTFKAVKPASAGSDPTTGAGTASDLVAFLIGSLRNLVFASKAGSGDVTTADLQASFSYGATDSPTVVTSPAISITPVAATLVNVTVPRTTAKLAPGNNLLLEAVGEYQTSDPVMSFSQGIGRHVAWSVAEADLATLTVQNNASTINPLAGVVLANAKAESGKMVVVTATNSNATGNKSATSTITIDPTEPQETP